MESESMRAGLDDPQRIEAARRLLAEARGEALDRLAALSARLLGAAHASIAIVTDEPVLVTPLPPRAPRAGALLERTVVHGSPLVLSDARTAGIAGFLGVPIDAAGARVGALAVYDPEPGRWT